MSLPADYDDWRTQAPDCDGPPPCWECGGRGTVLVVVREYHCDVHGFDAEDDERMCLTCEGTGVAL